MRADRLVAILLLLQQRRRVSAATLARELEVSRRTVMRDLEALGSAGVPIYSVRGPRGGYELWEGFRAKLTGLTADEVRALALWGLPHAAALFGLRDALRRAQLKVAMSLPAETQEDLGDVATMFLHDPVPIGEDRDAARNQLLAASVQGRRVLRVRRTPEEQPATTYPLALVDNAGTWLLVADIAGERTALAVDALHDIAPTGRRFHRPDDFDLPAFWAEWRSGRAPAS